MPKVSILDDSEKTAETCSIGITVICSHDTVSVVGQHGILCEVEW